MTRVLGSVRSASPLVTVLMLVSCASSGKSDWVELNPETTSGQEVHLAGTVHRMDVEGGLYVIRDATGTSYNPTNLPTEFRVDGLAVEADATRRDDVVSIGMVGTMVDLRRIRKVAGTGTESSGIAGTSWRLEDLMGTGVLDAAQATLEFGADGAVSGRGSCNRFSGKADIRGNTLSFSPLVSTKMACAEAVMDQEKRYFEALQGAERFERKGTFLYVYTVGLSDPLRFVAMSESETAPR